MTKLKKHIMKRKYYLPGKLCIIGITMMAILIIACSDMNELQQPFLDRGEIIYAAKVDSVVIRPGKNRIQFDLIVNSQRIRTARFFWNDYKDLESGVIMFKDSSDLEISGKGIFKKILAGMDERRYIFKLQTFDEFGNASLPTEINAYVYGQRYEDQLVARSVRSTSVGKNEELTIRWGIAEGALSSEIRYTNFADQVVIKSFPIAESVSFIEDLKPGTGYEYRTVYKPDTSGIDFFYTDFEPVSPPFTRGAGVWKVIAYSSQHGGSDNAVTNFIDGTQATRWHSCAGCSSYPHWATIDMGKVRPVSKFGVWITTFENPVTGDNRAPDKIKFHVSMDNTTWTDLGEFNFNRFQVSEQTFTLPPDTQARYFKFEGVSGTGSNMVMGEISAYY
jgi:hypothetical protein